LQIRENRGRLAARHANGISRGSPQIFENPTVGEIVFGGIETLAVIAYKQPATVPEFWNSRRTVGFGDKNLLDKRLIVARGRKETVGRPMQYGTSQGFFDSVRIKGFVGVAVNRRF
jgi:chromosome segregation and condensation protein ScpB